MGREHDRHSRRTERDGDSSHQGKESAGKAQLRDASAHEENKKRQHSNGTEDDGELKTKRSKGPQVDKLKDELKKKMAEEEKIRKRREKLAKWKQQKQQQEGKTQGSIQTPTPAVPTASDAGTDETAAPQKKVTLITKKPTAAVASAFEEDGDAADDSSVSSAPLVRNIVPGVSASMLAVFSKAKKEKLKKKKQQEQEAASAFSMDDDEDDADNKPTNASDKGKAPASTRNAADDVDELDAFMQNVNKEVTVIKAKDAARLRTRKQFGLIDQSARPENISEADGFDYPSSDEEDGGQEGSGLKKYWSGYTPKQPRELGVVDHSTIDYPSFQKSFYTPVPEIAKMTDEEVAQLRAELENVKVRGKDAPNPIKAWNQCGMSRRVLEILKKLAFDSPTPIQAQAIPVCMTGRDMLGIAKTGSGKTLAFLLPLIRHVLAQERVRQGEGCIAMIMSPTRELAVQTTNEARKFCKNLGLTVACVYGGSDVAEQIANLKRAADIIVCTPGRMIDMLTVNRGRVTNTRRITYVVLDEADRMFDMGFEPQVMRILDNIRPDRQTVMFSATFPRAMEVLARKILKNPIEVQVGGRSVVSDTVDQHIVILKEDDKFNKLLELLGTFGTKGSVIVFVRKQEKADTLLGNLWQNNYSCLALHGAVTQEDRASNIRDFKTGNVKILIATSVAARGLDVKELKLVVNYDSPDHYEDYVHRCGRTGRAGRTGTAYTFITKGDREYTGNIIKALKASNATVPKELSDMWDKYKLEMKKKGKKIGHSGFRGKGYKFSAEDLIRQKQMKLLALQAHAHGSLDDDYKQREQELMEALEDQVDILMGKKPKSDDTEGGDGDDYFVDDPDNDDMDRSIFNEPKKGQSADAEAAKAKEKKKKEEEIVVNTGVALGDATTRAQEALARAMALNQKYGFRAKADAADPDAPATDKRGVYQEEVEVNDWPQACRFEVTKKDFIRTVGEECGASISVRGTYFPPGKKPKEGERKIYICIESTELDNVGRAKHRVRQILKDQLHTAATTYQPRQQQQQGIGRYNVLALTN